MANTVKRCNRLCALNDPDEGCLLGCEVPCGIGPTQQIRAEEDEERRYSRAYIVNLIKQAMGNTTDYWASLVADVLIGQGVILVKEENPRDFSGYADKLRQIKEADNGHS